VSDDEERSTEDRCVGFEPVRFGNGNVDISLVDAFDRFELRTDIVPVVERSVVPLIGIDAGDESVRTIRARFGPTGGKRHSLPRPAFGVPFEVRYRNVSITQPSGEIRL